MLLAAEQRLPRPLGRSSTGDGGQAGGRADGRAAGRTGRGGEVSMKADCYSA